MSYETGQVFDHAPPSLPETDRPEFHPNKPLIFTALKLGRLIFHPQTHFEEGAEESILEHEHNDGAFLILMTHFKRREPGFLLPVVDKYDALSHLRYTTGLTAREELWNIPGLSHLLNAVNAQPVRRSTENPDETPEEKEARKDANQQKQAIAGKFLATGLNWIIWPEGSSRITVEDRNGNLKRVHRDTTTLFPIRAGFAYSLEAMTEQERQNVRLLVIASHFGPRILGSMRPTIFVRTPVSPIEGTRECRIHQAEELLRGGVEQAILLDAKRI